MQGKKRAKKKKTIIIKNRRKKNYHQEGKKENKKKKKKKRERKGRKILDFKKKKIGDKIRANISKVKSDIFCLTSFICPIMTYKIVIMQYEDM